MLHNKHVVKLNTSRLYIKNRSDSHDNKTNEQRRILLVQNTSDILSPSTYQYETSD